MQLKRTLDMKNALHGGALSVLHTYLKAFQVMSLFASLIILCKLEGRGPSAPFHLALRGRCVGS